MKTKSKKLEQIDEIVGTSPKAQTKKKRKTKFVVIIVSLLLLCCAIVFGATGFAWYGGHIQKSLCDNTQTDSGLWDDLECADKYPTIEATPTETLNNETPKLILNDAFLGDTTTTDNFILIEGETDEYSTISINKVLLKKEGTLFTYEYKLIDGENIIKIDAINQKGITTTKIIKVYKIIESTIVPTTIPIKLLSFTYEDCEADMIPFQPKITYNPEISISTITFSVDRDCCAPTLTGDIKVVDNNINFEIELEYNGLPQCDCLCSRFVTYEVQGINTDIHTLTHYTKKIN